MVHVPCANKKVIIALRIRWLLLFGRAITEKDATRNLHNVTHNGQKSYHLLLSYRIFKNYTSAIHKAKKGYDSLDRFSKKNTLGKLEEILNKYLYKKI